MLTSFIRYEYPKLLVYSSQNTDGEYEESKPVARIRWLFAFNLPCYAGGLKFTPSASGDDGLLDVCTFRRGSLWHLMVYFVALIFGRHHLLYDCKMWRAKRLKITSTKRVPYQLDGDPGGYLPVEIEMLPGRMTLMVPESKWSDDPNKQIN
jgi:diacylglycerol kinase family enzyme